MATGYSSIFLSVTLESAHMAAITAPHNKLIVADFDEASLSNKSEQLRT